MTTPHTQVDLIYREIGADAFKQHCTELGL